MLSKEASLALGVSPRTLWGYAEAGIVTPRRDQFGRRVYTEADLAAVAG